MPANHKPNVIDINEDLQAFKGKLDSTLGAIQQQLTNIINKDDLNDLKKGLATKNDIELIKEQIFKILDSKELESKIKEKISQYTDPVFDDITKRVRDLEMASKRWDLKQCENLLIINGINSTKNGDPHDILLHYLPGEFRNYNFRARFIGRDNNRRILMEFPNKYIKRDFQKKLRDERIGQILGINSADFIPESFDTARRGLAKLGMELKKSKTINHYEIITGPTDIFLSVYCTVNKKKFFSRTKGDSIHASISSFTPPLEELTNLKTTNQVTDNKKQNEEENANPMDTGNSPNDTAQNGGNITPTHPTDGSSHKRDRTADTPNSKEHHPSKIVKS